MNEDQSSSHEFLVSISNNLPADTPADERRSLVQKESARAMELAANGVIVRLWRIPGRRQNVGLWRASNASALHVALESLPMYPYLDITVTALASHPSDPHKRS
jgi:muconolactone D-isomerase